jgi:hypothetical protein
MDAAPRRLAALAVALAAVALSTARAEAASLTVSGGKLEWTMANHYAPGDPARTWLGYDTNTAPVAGPPSNGNVTAVAPATLADPAGAALTTIDGGSARGADKLFTLGYAVDATGSSYGEDGAGTIELGGTLKFVTHDIPITLADPVLKLDGLTGTLSGSGTAASQSGTPSTFDRTKTQFSLDLANAVVTLKADGSRVISGIVPVSTADTALSGFGPGSRLYGTMKLTLGVTYPATQVGAAGREGAPGPAGKDGTNGRDARFKTLTLSRAPFATGAAVHVKLLDRRTRAVVATGVVRRRTLQLSYLAGTKLKGSWTLRRTATKASGKREATITIR